ncbi:MAG: hypothetical protein WB564_01975 [Dehalococcoidia bacterium]
MSNKKLFSNFAVILSEAKNLRDSSSPRFTGTPQNNINKQCQIKVLFEMSSYVKIWYLRHKRKEIDDMKSYEELSREQGKRESSFLSDLGEASDFEADLGQRRDEILFKITTEMEDTKNALNQVEKLAQRLRKYLDRLEKIYQTLSK